MITCWACGAAVEERADALGYAGCRDCGLRFFATRPAPRAAYGRAYFEQYRGGDYFATESVRRHESRVRLALVRSAAGPRAIDLLEVGSATRGSSSTKPAPRGGTPPASSHRPTPRASVVSGSASPSAKALSRTSNSARRSRMSCACGTPSNTCRILAARSRRSGSPCVQRVGSSVEVPKGRAAWLADSETAGRRSSRTSTRPSGPLRPSRRCYGERDSARCSRDRALPDVCPRCPAARRAPRAARDPAARLAPGSRTRTVTSCFARSPRPRDRSRRTPVPAGA